LVRYPYPNIIYHYTQVVWADTYLVGCATAYYQSTAVSGFHFSFSYFISSNLVCLQVFGPKFPYNRLYICNYGPTGNVIGSPVYAQGRPASACPSNTKTSTAYPGLCAWEDDNTFTPKLSPSHFIFYQQLNYRWHTFQIGFRHTNIWFYILCWQHKTISVTFISILKYNPAF
jgi:hypothetical protein